MRQWSIAVFALAGAAALGACEPRAEPVEEEAARAEEELGLEGEAPPEAPPAADADIGEWDTDADARLAMEEFELWTDEAGLFEDWDTDAEAGLTEQEFGRGVFGLWDADEDDELTETEWREGMTTWWADAEYGTYDDWDQNDDQALDTDEFATGVDEYGLYDEWDQDGDAVLDETEFDEGLFDVFDENDDEYIGEDEWGTAHGAWDWMG